MLKVKGLYKKIKHKQILQDVSFSVPDNLIVGLLGPNGAGKSSTLKIIMQLWKSTNGNVKFILDEEPIEILENAVFISERFNFINSLSAIQNIKYFATYTGQKISKQEINTIYEKLNLSHRLKDKVKTYSMGMKQRLMLGYAMLRKSKLIILDEPTNGLDATGIKDLRELLFQIRDTGVTILVSSHILSEMQLLCDKFIIVLDGNVIKELNKKDFTEFTGNKTNLSFSVSESVITMLQNVLDDLNITHQIKENKFTLTVEKNTVQEVFALLTAKNIDYTDIEIKDENLEDIYTRFVKHSKID